ncbi:hypothetical protein [Allofustis seminis]|uniref:aldose epimerase family protein n=1 Tax=Allofustis seminis TaxID=166939 RepID=UPI00037DA249|nr:hypothetical protein [Allofustis seminis]
MSNNLNENLYVIENKYIKVVFSLSGLTIIDLIKKSNNTNFLLKYEDFNNYKENIYYLGRTIGRNAGRTRPPEYSTFDNKKVKLDTNEGETHLHGGYKGIHTKQWSILSMDAQSANLKLSDKNSIYENADLYAELKLINNEFHLSYKGESKDPTIFNITNHMYFNLSGEKTISNHYLTVNSSKVQLVDSEFVPLNKYGDLLKEEFDFLNFSEKKKINKSFDNKHDISKLCNSGIDLAYMIDSVDKDAPAIRLEESSNGNILEIITNQESVVYTLNKISNDYFDYNIVKFAGITFEAQRKPNFINIDNEYLKREYENKIVYRII